VSEWISPIDRHRHFGDAGRAECAVCCLEAERDHWRVLARREAADRDRLRAVVDALREHRALNGRFWQPDISDDEAVEAAEQEAQAWQAVVVALDQLDVSPDTGEPPPLREACADCEGRGCGTCDGMGWRINPDYFGMVAEPDTADFYVCPDHARTGGYEACCNCGGWTDDDPDRGRQCTEASE
jgi:hypothetical protein